jgi:outer membrane biosynthesis protein TonB
MEKPLVRAFVISVALHFFTFLVIEGGRKVGLWEQRVLPKSWTVAIKKPDAQQSEKETPILQFIEVDPAQTAPEEPKDTRFYSTANTTAANPDTRQNVPTPKIEGSQEKVLKTTDTAKVDPKPAAPPPEPPRKETLQPDLKQTASAPKEPVGDTKENTLTPEEKAQRDLTMDRPAPPQKPTPVRPRTLAQAREQKGIIESPKTRQEGGVSKYALESSMDVKSSPFGSYDAQFIAAVQSRWFALLDQRDYVGDRSGKVVIEFRLHSDGRIQQLRVAENSVTETLSRVCQQAILDPAPYARFPADLKRILGADYREVRFTFHYN